MMIIKNEKQVKNAEKKIIDLAFIISETYKTSDDMIPEDYVFVNAVIGSYINRMSKHQKDIQDFLHEKKLKTKV